MTLPAYAALGSLTPDRGILSHQALQILSSFGPPHAPCPGLPQPWTVCSSRPQGGVEWLSQALCQSPPLILSLPRGLVLFLPPFFCRLLCMIIIIHRGLCMPGSVLSSSHLGRFSPSSWVLAVPPSAPPPPGDHLVLGLTSSASAMELEVTHVCVEAISGSAFLPPVLAWPGPDRGGSGHAGPRIKAGHKERVKEQDRGLCCWEPRGFGGCLQRSLAKAGAYNWALPPLIPRIALGGRYSYTPFQH